MTDSRRRLRWLLISATVAAYAVAYVHLRKCGFIWDDDAYVVGNDTLRDANGLYRMWFVPGALPQYYPLVHTTFWIEFQLWGLEPLGYHVDNWILHGVNAWLVLLLLRRYSIPGAAIAAGVFLVHPVHVESVAWITERKNVLSGMFYLGAWLVWLRFEDSGRDGGRRSARLWTVMSVLFFCALMSKSVTATLPAAILLLGWWRDGRIAKRDLLALSPLFLAGLASGLYTAYLEMFDLAGTGAGASGEEWNLSAPERLLVAGRAFWFYASKTVWPEPLVFMYPRWTLDPASLAQWTWPVAAVGTIGALFALRNRIGRAPLTAALFHAGTLLPALGFLNVYPFRYSFVADHFQYLASLGVIALAVGIVRTHWKAIPGAALGALLVLPLVVVTNVRVRVYEGLKTLWLDTIAKNESCWMAHNNLGCVYMSEHRPDDALAQFRLTLHYKPDHHDAKLSIGRVAMERNDLRTAERLFREVIAAMPRHSGAWSNLGVVLAKSKRPAEAAEALRSALRLDPKHSPARQNLAILMAQQGEPEAALAVLRKGLELDRNDPGLLAQAAQILWSLGHHEEARGVARRALTLDSTEQRAADVLRK